jgi:hypothetical protein
MFGKSVNPGLHNIKIVVQTLDFPLHLYVRSSNVYSAGTGVVSPRTRASVLRIIFPSYLAPMCLCCVRS